MLVGGSRDRILPYVGCVPERLVRERRATEIERQHVGKATGVELGCGVIEELVHNLDPAIMLPQHVGRRLSLGSVPFIRKRDEGLVLSLKVVFDRKGRGQRSMAKRQR